MSVVYNRTSSEEQVVALCRQHPDQTPSSSKLSSTSPVKGWGDNVKLQFPWTGGNGRVKFWPGYNGTQSNNTVACGDVTMQGHLNSDHESGEMYCKDHYNTSNKPHNAIWCMTWDPYPFAVKGLSFNMKTRTTGVSWGFGNMWLLYEKPDGKHHYAAVTPNWTGEWKSKTPYEEQWKFHTKRHENYSSVNCQDVSKSDTWANFQGGPMNQDELNNYMCIGWAGFLTIMNRAGTDSKHGFYFEDLYLLPDKCMPRTWSNGQVYQWVGGKCGTKTDFLKGDRKILLHDAADYE